jgi:hypothetical protein
MTAAASGQSEPVLLLLQHGARADATDRSGLVRWALISRIILNWCAQTAMHYAKENGCSRVVRVLTSHAQSKSSGGSESKSQPADGAGSESAASGSAPAGSASPSGPAAAAFGDAADGAPRSDTELVMQLSVAGIE